MKETISKTIGRSLGNESLGETLSILGVPQIRAGADPEGYNLSYSVLLKKFFCFNLRKKNLVVKLCVLRLGFH